MRYNRSAGQLTRRYAKVKSNAYIGRHISSIAIGTQFEKLPSIILGNKRNAAVTRQALAEKQIRPRRTLIPPNATRKKDSRSDACRALVPISTGASCSSPDPSPPISGINSAPLTVALIGLIKSRKSRDKSSSIGSIFSHQRPILDPDSGLSTQLETEYSFVLGLERALCWATAVSFYFVTRIII